MENMTVRLPLWKAPLDSGLEKTRREAMRAGVKKKAAEKADGKAARGEMP